MGVGGLEPKMAQRQCMAAARRLASAPERVRIEQGTVTRNIPQSLRREQQRSITISSRAQRLSPRGLPKPNQPRIHRGPAYNRIRTFSTTSPTCHGDLTPPKPGFERHVTFVDKEGQRHTFEVSDGDNLLDIAQANDLEMEGACGGSCACSTCHVIVTDGEGEGSTADEMFDKMEEPSDDENDMLDLAFGLTETSRLGCQVVMSKELDGLVVSTRAADRL